MVGFTNAEEVAILDWYFRGQAKVPLATHYLALFSAAGNDDGSYTEITVAQYDTYARLQVDAANWAAAAGGDPSTIANSVKHTYPLATGGTGVTATHWGLFDVQPINTGSMKFHGVVTIPGGGLPISSGIQPEFAIGALVARLGDLP